MLKNTFFSCLTLVLLRGTLVYHDQSIKIIQTFPEWSQICQQKIKFNQKSVNLRTGLVDRFFADLLEESGKNKPILYPNTQSQEESWKQSQVNCKKC